MTQRKKDNERQIMPGSYVGSKIVVPLDGSTEVRAALGPAAEIAAASHGELVLAIVVTEAFERMVNDFIHLEHATPEQAAKMYLLGVQEGLSGELDDVRFSFEIRTNERPIETILEIVDDVDATMIAMTSHGHSGVRKALLGSVADAVLKKATIPVLLVPLEDRS
jgi:nucleotide-binding universal stress UspA family protein